MRKLHHLYPLPVDQLQWGEHQIGAAIRPRFRQVVNQPLRVDGLQSLQGERRAGTVAQQPLEPGPVIGLDPDRGIDREAAVVASLGHVLTTDKNTAITIAISSTRVWNSRKL